MSPTGLIITTTKEEEDKQNDAVMEKLRVHSDASSEVRGLLKAYNVKVKYNTNVKNLLKATDDTLHATTEFLGGKPLNDAGQPMYRSRESLVDWIIMAIEEMFPQHCSACNQQYTLERGSTPKLRCASCGGGSHNCDQVMSHPALTVPGFVWVCFGCIKNFKVETLSGMDGETEPPRTGSSERKFSFPTTQGKRDDIPDIEQNEEVPKPGEVCSFYLRRKCRHGRLGTKKWKGETCSKKHPEICRKYSNYGTTRHRGCNRGADCRFFHPPLCRSSELKRECYKTDCPHQHLMHTRRSEDEDGWEIAGSRKRKPPGEAHKRSGSRSRSRKRNESSNSQNEPNRSRNASGNSRPTWNRSRTPSRQETESNKEEDFFERLLERLTNYVPNMVANEFNKQLKANSNVSWNLPLGTCLTQAAR